MNYSDKFKQNNPIAFLTIENAIKNNKLAHAYLFSSQPNTNIEDEYLYFIQKLISTDSLRDPKVYPDLTVLDGSETIIKKSTVSDAVEKLSQTTLDSSGKKFLVIKNIENTNKQSINSLLKFIEEPTEDTFILMTTNRISAVINTIKSRSQIINIKNVNKDLLSEQIEKVGLKNSRLLANISNSIEDAKSKSEMVMPLLENIKTSLSEAVSNPDSIVANLTTVIKKSNYLVVLNVIKEFYSDVWREENLMEISFIDSKDILQKYALSNFDIASAIECINEFIINQTHYANFELAKSKMLIKLGECYV